METQVERAREKLKKLEESVDKFKGMEALKIENEISITKDEIFFLTTDTLLD